MHGERREGSRIKLIGPKAIIAIAFLIILFLTALFTGGRLPYMVLYIYSFVLLISLAVSFISLYLVYHYVDVDKATVTVGDVIEMRIELENSSILPVPYLMLNIHMLSDMIEKKNLYHNISLSPKEAVTIKNVLSCGHYGFYDLDAITITAVDVFGIFAVSKNLSSNLKLRIYPKWYPLSYLALPSYQQMGYTSNKQRFMEDFADMGGIRSYRWGDNIKRVHWKLSAKKNELMVKDFVFNANTQACIVIDTYGKDYGDQVVDLSERAAECAASLLYYCLAHDVYTGLLFHDAEKVALWGNNLGIFAAFMEAIIRTKMQGTVPISELLANEGGGLPWGTTLIVIVPHLERDTLSVLSSLKDGGYGVACIYVGSNSNPDQMSAVAYLKERGIKVHVLSLDEDIPMALAALSYS